MRTKACAEDVRLSGGIIQGMEQNKRLGRRPSKPTPKPERLLYSIKDAAWALSISPGHVRNLVDAGVLARVRMGRRILISAETIKNLIAAGGTDIEEAPQRNIVVELPDQSAAH